MKKFVMASHNKESLISAPHPLPPGEANKPLPLDIGTPGRIHIPPPTLAFRPYERHGAPRPRSGSRHQRRLGCWGSQDSLVSAQSVPDPVLGALE